MNWQYKQWSAWKGTAHVLLSDDTGANALGYFKTADDAINWLYLKGYKDAARVLNMHVKANPSPVL